MEIPAVVIYLGRDRDGVERVVTDKPVKIVVLEDSIEGVEPDDPDIVEIDGNAFFYAAILNELNPEHVRSAISSLSPEKLKRNEQEPPSTLKTKLLQILYEYLSDDFIHHLSEELADNAMRLAAPTGLSEKEKEHLHLMLIRVLSTFLGDDAMQKQKAAEQLTEETLKALRLYDLEHDPDDAITCAMGR